MELTHDDVVRILELLERSNVEYLEIETGGTRIVADRSGTTTRARGGVPATAGPPAHVASAAHVAPAAPPAPSAPEVEPPPPAPAAAPAQPGGTASGTAAAAGLVTVTAPVLGVFFRAPEPGAPAFVEVGSQVQEGATLGLVEVMKMFNGVAAPTAGEVVEVLAANEEFVEYGQPLVRLRPAGV